MELQNTLTDAADCKNSSTFWNKVKSILRRGVSVTNKISPAKWSSYFETLLNPTVESGDKFFNDHVKNFLGEHNNYCEDCIESNVTSPLNADITVDEVRCAIRDLKNNKAAGEDAIPGEFFKQAINSGICEVLQKLFNLILQSGKFPDKWQTSIIVPLYKKGDANETGNYRGISLLAVMSKIFTKIIGARLTKWSEINSALPEEQAGFRKGYSTIDNIFNLQALIQKFLSKRKNVFYCAFVDFAKAFDCVDHEKLFYCLIKQNIHGRIIDVLQSIYSNVKAKVKVQDGLSQPFICKSGVKQGCILSPLMFSIYVNELSSMLNHIYGEFDFDSGIFVTEAIRRITHLFFADDLVIFSDTVSGLQRKLNKLAKYCNKWGMTVNLGKTNVMVFKNGGHLSRLERWTYNGEPIAAVNYYKYLGIVFSCRLIWTTACKTLAQQASKAANMVKNCLTKLGKRDTRVAFKLFDSMIAPILGYGAEIWGTHYRKDIEAVHIKFCKWLLCTGNNTNNFIALGECGRQEMCTNYFMKPIKYLLRLFEMEDSRLPKQCFHMLRDLDAKGRVTWCTHVKNMLFSNGFGVIWENQGVGDARYFLEQFKRRLCDINLQKWSEYIHSSSKCELYSYIKSTPKVESCMNTLSFTLRYALFNLRCSTHNLEIEAGRRAGIPREERLCKLCNMNEIEDELHFMLKCPILRDVRISFLPAWSYKNPLLPNLIKLLSTADDAVTKNTAIYIKKANDIRVEMLTE